MAAAWTFDFPTLDRRPGMAPARDSRRTCTCTYKMFLDRNNSEHNYWRMPH